MWGLGKELPAAVSARLDEVQKRRFTTTIAASAAQLPDGRQCARNHSGVGPVRRTLCGRVESRHGSNDRHPIDSIGMAIVKDVW
jgi:hypothetical protein